MSKLSKVIMCVMLTLMLSGCGTTQVVPVAQVVKRAPLEIAQNPLAMEGVKFKVFSLDGTLYIALDTENFARLARNMEKIQNRLNEDRVIIQKTVEYNN